MSYSISTWRDVVIGVWWGSPADSSIADLNAGITTVLKNWPSVALLNIAAAGVEMPTPYLRVELKGLMRARTPVFRCGALVVEPDGFRAAAIRATVSGISLLVRRPFPSQTFRSVEDAAAWLAPMLCPTERITPPPHALALAVERVRAGDPSMHVLRKCE